MDLEETFWANAVVFLVFQFEKQGNVIFIHTFEADWSRWEHSCFSGYERKKQFIRLSFQSLLKLLLGIVADEEFKWWAESLVDYANMLLLAIIEATRDAALRYTLWSFIFNHHGCLKISFSFSFLVRWVEITLQAIKANKGIKFILLFLDLAESIDLISNLLFCIRSNVLWFIRSGVVLVACNAYVQSKVSLKEHFEDLY